MAREIKFRAWQLNKMIHPEEYENQITSLYEFIGNLTDDAILMQFTGLKDCKGNDIYEGDIVRLRNEEGESDVRLCEWNNEAAEFWFPREFKDGKFDWIYLNTTFEVIGNIYQHPDLLTKD